MQGGKTEGCNGEVKVLSSTLELAVCIGPRLCTNVSHDMCTGISPSHSPEQLDVERPLGQRCHSKVGQDWDAQVVGEHDHALEDELQGDEGMWR